MEPSLTTPSAASTEHAPLADRLRERLIILQARVAADAARVRTHLGSVHGQIRQLAAIPPADISRRVGDRVCAALDLPRSSQLTELVARLDTIERRLAILGAEPPRELSGNA